MISEHGASCPRAAGLNREELAREEYRNFHCAGTETQWGRRCSSGQFGIDPINSRSSGSKPPTETPGIRMRGKRSDDEVRSR